ncbi:MAG: hypothetical protein QXP36_13720 [Conexivisphaerales archaeon]
MKSDMSQHITQPLDEGEIEKQYMNFFEIGNQLSEVITQTLSVKTGTNNKSLEKAIARDIKNIKGLIKDYQMALKDKTEKYDFWGWIEPNKHLEYLARLNAALKVYAMLTGDDASQVRQKLNELEDEVYNTLGSIYTAIVKEKSDRINVIQKIINKSVKARAKKAIIENSTTICKLKSVSAENETIKILLDIAAKEAKKLQEELINFKNENIEITSVNDVLAFLKKVSELLEKSAVILTLDNLISAIDDEFAIELDLESSAYFAHYKVLFIAEDLQGRNIDHYEWLTRVCADKELSKYYTSYCSNLTE